MRKKTKVWLIIASSLVVFGLITFAAVMNIYNWDLTKLSTVKYETNTYQLSEEFSNISIKTTTSDIIFANSDNGIVRVVCYEIENTKHYINVQDNTLTINENDNRKWYEYIGISIGNPKITIYLPDNEYNRLSVKESTGNIEIPKQFMFESIDISTNTGDVKNYASTSDLVKIKTSTGDIRVEDISAGSVELSVSTGNVIAQSITCDDSIKINVSTGDTQLTDIECKTVISNGSTGNISLKNVIATENFSIERSTGNVKFNSCDAEEIFVKTDTGDVTGSLLTDKVFINKTSTGSIDVPTTMTGGKCEINTDTGDIKINILY